MPTEKPNIQDTYLNEARKAEASIRLLLCTGKELRGKVLGFDSFTILLESHKVELLVYKSSVAVIGPDLGT